MAKRSSASDQTGAAGENEVAAEFQRLGWTCTKVAHNDTGTDALILVKDERLEDSGLIMGAQIKSGPTWFRRTKKESGKIVGWWFYENEQDHFDGWIKHRAPHIVVLRNMNTRTSYWAHVTIESVHYTPNGARVFIPKAQVISEKYRPQLLEVAASAAHDPLQGMAWSGAKLIPSDQWRYALLIPRVVAPHPNKGLSDDLDPSQVAALYVQMRMWQLDRKSWPDHEGKVVERPWEIGGSWAWEFTIAIRKFIENREVDLLRKCESTAASTHERTAASIVLAAALHEVGNFDETLSLLEQLLKRDDAGTVDRGWTRLQLARSYSEVGRFNEALALAREVLPLSLLAPSDVTAVGIAGAAANLIVSLEDWKDRDLSAAIAAGDNPLTWWRGQVLSWGFGAQAEASFLSRVQDGTSRWSADETAYNNLRSASLMAGFLGDRNAWRQSLRATGQYLLSAVPYQQDPETLRLGLQFLRSSGDHESLRRAVRHLINQGPAVVARDEALDVGPNQSSRTTAHADLDMLIGASDLLPEARVDVLAGWAMSVYGDPRQYVERVRPNYSPFDLLGKLLAALTPVASYAKQEAIADFVLSLPIIAGQVDARPLSSVVNSLPVSIWTSERSRVAAERQGDDWTLKYAFQAVARDTETVRSQLLAEVREGHMPAVTAIGDLTAIDPSTVAEACENIEKKVLEQIKDLSEGRSGFGGFDLGEALTILSIWHPIHARWDTIVTLLVNDPYRDHISETLHRLGTSVGRLPDKVKERLLTAVDVVIAKAPPPNHFGDQDPTPEALYLQGALRRAKAQAIATQYVKLIGFGERGKKLAAELAGQERDEVGLGVLLGLRSDDSPSVRALAARSIAQRAGEGDEAASLAITSLEGEGALTAQAVAVAVARYPALRDHEHLSELDRHMSSFVRQQLQISAPSGAN